MILVDIYIPSIDREFDFELDETSNVSSIIEEVASMISQKEQCELKGNMKELLLCNLLDQTILPQEKKLEECGIINGTRLILI